MLIEAVLGHLDPSIGDFDRLRRQGETAHVHGQLLEGFPERHEMVEANVSKTIAVDRPLLIESMKAALKLMGHEDRCRDALLDQPVSLLVIQCALEEFDDLLPLAKLPASTSDGLSDGLRDRSARACSDPTDADRSKIVHAAGRMLLSVLPKRADGVEDRAVPRLVEERQGAVAVHIKADRKRAHHIRIGALAVENF